MNCQSFQRSEHHNLHIYPSKYADHVESYAAIIIIIFMVMVVAAAVVTAVGKQCYVSATWFPATCHETLGSVPGQSMWGL
jgi:hypothetical protein